MATAVCVVDMLNPYDHEDAGRLTRNVEPVVEPIAALVERARDEDLADAALKMMERNMRAELAACADCKLEA